MALVTIFRMIHRKAKTESTQYNSEGQQKFSDLLQRPQETIFLLFIKFMIRRGFVDIGGQLFNLLVVL